MLAWLTLSNPDFQRTQGAEEATIDGSRMSFLDHLSELAKRLKKCLIAFIIALAVVSSLPNPLHPFGGPYALFGYNFLLLSLLHAAVATWLPAGTTTFVPGITDPISIFINLSLVSALIVSLPYIFGQIYGFVAPGLYQREKKAVRKYLLPFTLLFATGGLFGLFIIFPTVMRILLDFFPAVGAVSLVSITDFVNLLLLIPVVTGLAFTFPVFILPLVELRVISANQLSKSRKWVYVGVALAVSIANPDPTDISSIPIVVPILILFEITVLIAKRIEKKRNAVAAQGPAA